MEERGGGENGLFPSLCPREAYIYQKFHLAVVLAYLNLELMISNNEIHSLVLI